MGKALKHFITVTKHRNAVMKHCFKAGIPFQGLLHDLSKYSFEEFFNGVKYFQGNRSPHEAERETIGYSAAWMHHKGRNKHHFEYWTDYNYKTKQIFSVKMPVKYVKEMFCDRVAASKIYMKDKYHDGAALEYFMRGKARRNVDKDTSDLIESLLVMLSEKGEKETFAYIRGLKEYPQK
ncbi:MAG: DUF5662 family protein [Oscillospiraceae bacterium]